MEDEGGPKKVDGFTRLVTRLLLLDSCASSRGIKGVDVERGTEVAIGIGAAIVAGTGLGEREGRGIAVEDW